MVVPGEACSGQAWRGWSLWPWRLMSEFALPPGSPRTGPYHGGKLQVCDVAVDELVSICHNVHIAWVLQRHGKHRHHGGKAL